MLCYVAVAFGCCRNVVGASSLVHRRCRIIVVVIVVVVVVVVVGVIIAEVVVVIIVIGICHLLVAVCVNTIEKAGKVIVPLLAI